MNKRSTARNMNFLDCSVRGVSIGPAVIEDITIDKLKVHSHLQTWGAVFKHVVIKGFVNRLMITPYYDAFGNMKDIEKSFATANTKYYESVDWALDISEGLFTDCDIRGIPADLIRRDSATQVIVRREEALKNTWKELDLSKTPWKVSIESLLKEGFNDCVLVAPKKSKNFTIFLEGLNSLRKAGIAEPN